MFKRTVMRSTFPKAEIYMPAGSRASSQSPGEVSQRMEVSSTNQNAETPGVNASESNPAAAVDPARACEGANGPAEAHKPLETTVPDLGVPWCVLTILCIKYLAVNHSY